MSNPILTAIEQKKLIPKGKRVLVRGVSFLEDMIIKGGGNTIIAPADSEHADKNIVYFIVEAVGPKVSENIKVGMRVLHASAAADRVAGKYGIVREKYLIAEMQE